MKDIEAGCWVRIHGVVLNAGQRVPGLPDDTQNTALEIWQKGYLLADAQIGDEVGILTLTGRKAQGTLLEVNPHFELNYGNFRPELLRIGTQVRDLLFGEDRSDAQ